MTAVPVPLDHGRALDLAAAAPAFPLTDAESRELGSHLRACADCRRRAARLRSDLAAVGAVDPALSPRLHDRLREVAVTAPRSGPSPLGLVLVLSLVAVGIVGASLGVGALTARPAVETPAPFDPRPDVVAVDTGTVVLRAKEAWIDAAGTRFTVPANATWHSDGSDPERWTLEASWTQGDVEQRLTLTFAADAMSWWVERIESYDGTAGARKASWVTYDGGPWARTARGGRFSGAIDAAGTGAGGAVRLHLDGVTLESHPRDALDAPVLAPGAVPPTQREVICSGALQLPPVAAATRLRAMGATVDWRWQYATGANTGQSEVRDQPPATGYISGIAPGAAGSIVVFVEDPARPMLPAATLPPDCPAP